MKGMNRQTGKFLSGIVHLKQSLQDILTTTARSKEAKGERLICRDYGSKLFSYIDQPLTDHLTLEIMAEVANVLHSFEPRIQLTKVSVVSKDAINGHLTLNLEGLYENEAFIVENVEL